jgi:apolipoprotein N-acyltransferase
VVTNTAIAVAVRSDAAMAARVGSVAVAAALVVAGAGWGAARGEPPVDGHLRIAGVQPGKIDPPDERLEANERITAEIDVPVDLIVWGQSSVGFDPATDEQVRQRLEAVADEAGTDVLVNVDARRPDGRISKSAVIVRPDVGLDDEYDKQRLVPFGEYIPLRPVFGWVAEFTDAAAEDRVPGGDLTLIRVGDVEMGPLISYESTFPDLRRALAGMDAELTVVQGASTTFQGTWAQPQQASFEAVRAVESGRSAVLVTVSGTSAAFDARGRELAWVPSDFTGWYLVEVPLSQEATPFVRFGDWVPVLSLVIVLAAAAAEAWRRWSTGRPPTADDTDPMGTTERSDQRDDDRRRTTGDDRVERPVMTTDGTGPGGPR